MDFWWETEEFKKEQQELFRKWCDEQHKKWEEDKKKREEWEAKIPPDQRQGAFWVKQNAINTEKIARGEIVDVFIRQHLEENIKIERWKLGIGILLTALFKYQIIWWIILVILYAWKVNMLTKEAQKVDRERWMNNK